jgi:hypothetical protein
MIINLEHPCFQVSIDEDVEPEDLEAVTLGILEVHHLFLIIQNEGLQGN